MPFSCTSFLKTEGPLFRVRVKVGKGKEKSTTSFHLYIKIFWVFHSFTRMKKAAIYIERLSSLAIFSLSDRT